MNRFLNKKNKKNAGFGLIELILYIALVSVFITGSVVFAWDVIYGSAKSKVQREVNQNIRLAGKRITYEIRNASALNYLAPDALCLVSSDPARNPTKIYLNEGRLRVAWGGGSVDCTGMPNDYPLISKQVTVSDLNFVDRSAAETSLNIEYSFTVSSAGTRQEWQKSQRYTGSVEVR